MSQDDKKQTEKDLFIANKIYPDGESVFAFRPKPLEAIKDDCYIVFDTNALLVPYTTSRESLEQIRKTCKPLVEQKRIIIPGQVAREFAKHRANKIAELHQQLLTKRDSISTLRLGPYPLLESSESYKESLQLEDEINKLLNQYRDTISKVLDHIQGWTWDDPVSQLYCELFSQGAVLDKPFDEEEVKKDLVRRKLHSIPPGYKDAGVGDLLIWQTILGIGSEHKKSVIFVSGDEKTDWFHQSHKQALYPRYELVDEFRRHSDGQSFHIVRFSAFLNLYGASDKVVEEVRKEEVQLNTLTASDDSNLEDTYGTARPEDLYNAAQAVSAWLVRNYPNSRISYQARFPMYTIEASDGSKIAVDVRFFREAHIFARNWKARSKLRDIIPIIKEFSEFHLILVGVNEKAGYSLAHRVAFIRGANPDMKIIVGYIAPDGSFSTSVPSYIAVDH